MHNDLESHVGDALSQLETFGLALYTRIWSSSHCNACEWRVSSRASFGKREDLLMVAPVTVATTICLLLSAM